MSGVQLNTKTAYSFKIWLHVVFPSHRKTLIKVILWPHINQRKATNYYLVVMHYPCFIYPMSPDGLLT